MTFRTHLNELDVRKERSQSPDDSMKLYIIVVGEFEAPLFLNLTRLFHNLTAKKPPWVKRHANICSGFFRIDRRQYSGQEMSLKKCVEVWLQLFLTSAPDNGEWLTSRPGRFTPRKHYKGAQKLISCFYQESNPAPSSP
jgi:hypothetical protein